MTVPWQRRDRPVTEAWPSHDWGVIVPWNHRDRYRDRERYSHRYRDRYRDRDRYCYRYTDRERDRYRERISQRYRYRDRDRYSFLTVTVIGGRYDGMVTKNL